MMTGDDRYLEAAEKGTDYLREHLRNIDPHEDIVFWYHAIDVSRDRVKKIYASEFGDDFDAIPAYEQIYALAGPTQTYRITGDPSILQDIHMTLNLFDKYFLDKKLGGYFSHVDPVTFDPHSESLGGNRGRKNWNSVGDHTPAYLINAYLATGDERFSKMLLMTADTITDHFQDYDNSPFVQEKFHEDWTHDITWGWQQNRGVVGHNLKIAWNLTRVNNFKNDDRYMDFAERIAELMPAAGGDRQRGGWYDVVSRVLSPGQTYHRYAWHDRKAWWQQEQGILAYMILAGTMKKPEYLKLARESAAFYNAWFLDHDSGAVYFNVLANGLPYLQGTERKKGSHSMSGYHSFELAYLAAVYSNLLNTKQPMDFYFKPKPGSFPDGILRVAPDLLPKDSIRIDSVTVDGTDYTEFDADALTVTIPESSAPVAIKVRIVPTAGLDHFNATLTMDGSTAKITLTGEIDSRAVPTFRSELADAIAANPDRLVIEAKGLSMISAAGARALVFAKQKMDFDEQIVIVDANDDVKAVLNNDEFSEEVTYES